MPALRLTSDAVQPRQRQLDVEYLAFSRGIKPAVRISGTTEEVEAAERRYRELGAEVRRGRRVIASAERWIAYVAHSDREAERMRYLDGVAPTLTWLRKRWNDPNVELGRLLGYPDCCVKAFGRRARGRRLKTEHDWYRAACAARLARSDFRLNVLLMAEGRSLLSFEPCRYDCANALELRSLIADAVRADDPEWLDYVECQARLPIAVGPDGARAHVELDRRIGQGGARIVRAWPPVAPRGTSQEKDVGLARRIEHLVVTADGWVPLGLAKPAPVVVDFSNKACG